MGLMTMVLNSTRMVTTRNTSKKSGTSSTPPTGDRDLTGQLKQLPGSPCSIAKKMGHKRDDGGDTLCGKNLMTADKLSLENSKNEIAPSSSAAQSAELKEGEYVIPQNKWKYLQVNKIGPSTKVIEDIASHLDAEHVVQFKEYSVGHLLDVDPNSFGFWPGLIRYMLIHQLYYPGSLELVFNFSNCRLTFGCPEFCIVTGLPHVGELGLSFSCTRLLNKYGVAGN